MTPIDLAKLKSLLSGTGIEVHGLSGHSKASEAFVETTFHDIGNKFKWQGHIPYHDRRHGLFLQTEEEVAAYLQAIRHHFEMPNIQEWMQKETAFWEVEMAGRSVTKPFFDELARFEWTKNFPPNNNPQRRIQDIKDLGYVVATKRVGMETWRLLVPIPKAARMRYEVFSKAFKRKALKALNELNVYDLSSVGKADLLPEHKFPEIRWDAATRAENPEDMDEAEIKQKYQLLDNQRNEQKREVCRKCFQTGKRGILFGIKYFYEGGENWPSDVPKQGKEAEKGCFGCGWYDIEKWRKALNDLLGASSKPAI